ncbi:hypothetical protein D3C73_790160 [compost metagenome]
MRLQGHLLEQAIQLHLVEPAGPLGVDQAHAVALVEDAVVAAGLAVAEGIEPVLLQLLAIVVEQVEALQLGTGGHAPSADGVVDRRYDAGDRGAVGTVRIGRRRIVAAGHHVT